ncbi:hypothetical protein BC941DRAFT_506505 [Chlamydoabsidia padenii]|nr:hypothetical protein BC941DRAFT_506505 [Chlamydoabsidia padenii]
MLDIPHGSPNASDINTLSVKLSDIIMAQTSNTKDIINCKLSDLVTDKQCKLTSEKNEMDGNIWRFSVPLVNVNMTPTTVRENLDSIDTAPPVTPSPCSPSTQAPCYQPPPSPPKAPIPLEQPTPLFQPPKKTTITINSSCASGQAYNVNAIPFIPAVSSPLDGTGSPISNHALTLPFSPPVTRPIRITKPPLGKGKTPTTLNVQAAPFSPPIRITKPLSDTVASPTAFNIKAAPFTPSSTSTTPPPSGNSQSPTTFNVKAAPFSPIRITKPSSDDQEEQSDNGKIQSPTIFDVKSTAIRITKPPSDDKLDENNKGTPFNAQAVPFSPSSIITKPPSDDQVNKNEQITSSSSSSSPFNIQAAPFSPSNTITKPPSSAIRITRPPSDHPPMTYNPKAAPFTPSMTNPPPPQKEEKPGTIFSAKATPFIPSVVDTNDIDEQDKQPRPIDNIKSFTPIRITKPSTDSSPIASNTKTAPFALIGTDMGTNNTSSNNKTDAFTSYNIQAAPFTPSTTPPTLALGSSPTSTYSLPSSPTSSSDKNNNDVSSLILNSPDLINLHLID